MSVQTECRATEVLNPWRPVRAMVSQPRVKQAEGLRHPGFPHVPGLKTIAPCKGNVSANRMQNMKARFQYFAEVQPDFAKQYVGNRGNAPTTNNRKSECSLTSQSKNTSIELYKIILNTYLFSLSKRLFLVQYAVYGVYHR